MGMPMPDVSNLIKDPETGGFYNVLAYRKLTREEMVEMVRVHLSKKGAPKATKRKRINIVTSIGHAG